MADLKVSELPVISSATNDDLFIINDGNITTSTLNWTNLKASIDVLTGQIEFATSGTELAPTIYFSGDPNTGIYRPAEDNLSFVTNGDTAIHIDAEGKVGIANEAAASYDNLANVAVFGSSAAADQGITILSGVDELCSIFFADGTAAGSRDAGRIVYDHSTDYLKWYTGATARLTLTNDGFVGIGTEQPDDFIHISSGVSGVTGVVADVKGVIIESPAGTDAGVQFQTANTDAAGIYFGDPENSDASHIIYDHAADDLQISVAGADRITINNLGFVGLNDSPVIGNLVTLGGAATGLTSFNGYVSSTQIGSTVTGVYSYYRSSVNTENATFTLGTLNHFVAGESVIGADSTITNQYGFFADPTLNSAQNNYGFYSAVSGANNYSFYSANNSKNYFNNSQFKVAVGGTDELTIDTWVTAHTGIVFEPGNEAARPGSPIQGFARFNSDSNEWEGYNGTQWVDISGGSVCHVGITPPTDKKGGDFWWDTDSGKLFIWYIDGNGDAQWVATDPSIGEPLLETLGDVTLNNPQSGQILRYNGSTWVNDYEWDVEHDETLIGTGKVESPLEVDVPQVKSQMGLATVATSGSYNDLTDLPTPVDAGVPSGTIIHSLAATAPTGYLACEGQTVLRADYPDLYAAIGDIGGSNDGSTNFVIPDLRGEFLRGADNGRGLDTGRTVGTVQSGQFASHTHNVNDPGHDHSTGQTLSTNYGGGGVPGPGNFVKVGPKAPHNPASWSLGITDFTDITIDSSGGTETRPRNYAVNVYIKS